MIAMIPQANPVKTWNEKLGKETICAMPILLCAIEKASLKLINLQPRHCSAWDPALDLPLRRRRRPLRLQYPLLQVRAEQHRKAMSHEVSNGRMKKKTLRDHDLEQRWD